MWLKVLDQWHVVVSTFKLSLLGGINQGVSFSCCFRQCLESQRRARYLVSTWVAVSNGGAWQCF